MTEPATGIVVPECPECHLSDRVEAHDPDCPKRAVHFDWSCDRCGFGFDED